MSALGKTYVRYIFNVIKNKSSGMPCRDNAKPVHTKELSNLAYNMLRLETSCM